MSIEGSYTLEKSCHTCAKKHTPSCPGVGSSITTLFLEGVVDAAAFNGETYYCDDYSAE